MHLLIFLSDFGLADPYVGQVKGVLHRLARGVEILDLTHELPPYAIRSGAWMIARALPYMPEPAVWLCVVDPGVGGERQALCVRWGDSFALGPDNGLLTPFLDLPGARAGRIDPHSFRNPAPTFHGRDLFAPAAARLLGGDLHPPWLDGVRSSPVRCEGPGWGRDDQGWWGEVMWVDRFGNLITALPGSVLPSESSPGRLRGSLEGQPCGSLVRTFSSVGEGEGALVVGGFGTVEVVVNLGSALQQYGVGVGGKLRVAGP
ncbi:MAG: SAM-dependent chlorinase/fluorinase [Magnetococcales bacterium]|nr:SAM-dependent chlorinase/fluorinase [Magnetococcales bacterium]